MKKASQSFFKKLQWIAGIISAILVVMYIYSGHNPLIGAVHVSMAGALVLAGINFSGKSLEELRELRGQITEELNGIVTTCETEKRDLNETEISRREELLSSLTKTKSEIRAKEILEEEARDGAGKQFKKEKKDKEKREIASYSFTKAIREFIHGGLTGLEAEMDQEARSEGQKSGFSIEGIGVPSMVLKRDVTATGATTSAGDQGGTLIPTVKMGFIDALRANMVLSALGTQFLTGLTGNASIPKKSSASNAAWGTEISDAPETQPVLGSVELTPHRLAAFTEVSKQLILQSSQDIESMVQSDLETAVRLALEYAAINGPGTSGSPKGVLNIAGIGSVIGGTNGLIPTWDNILALESKVAINNADAGTLAYLTNPAVRGKLKATPKVANYPEYIWGNDNTAPLNGYKAAVTTQVPSSFVKGTSNNCSAILFGNFNDLIVAQWGGIDLVVDPYTLAKKGMIALTINSYWDVAVRHPESFAAMLDALSA